jgi:hypothetical protein
VVVYPSRPSSYHPSAPLHSTPLDLHLVDTRHVDIDPTKYRPIPTPPHHLTYLLPISNMSISSYRVSSHFDTTPSQTLDKRYVDSLVGTLDTWPNLDLPSSLTRGTCRPAPFMPNNIIRLINHYIIISCLSILFIKSTLMLINPH